MIGLIALNLNILMNISTMDSNLLDSPENDAARSSVGDGEIQVGGPSTPCNSSIADEASPGNSPREFNHKDLKRNRSRLVQIPPSNLSERRGSTRAIKRKKFDDEVVESSLSRKSKTEVGRCFIHGISTSSCGLSCLTRSRRNSASSTGSGAGGSFTSQKSPSGQTGTPTVGPPPTSFKSQPSGNTREKSTRTTTDQNRPHTRSGSAACQQETQQSATRHYPSRRQNTSNSDIASRSSNKDCRIKPKENASTNKSKPVGFVPSEKSQEIDARLNSTSGRSSIGNRSCNKEIIQKKRTTASQIRVRIKKQKQLFVQQSNHLKWKSSDDFLLISSVVRCNDLMVYQQVEFSEPFTIEDLDERWYTLLYDDIISDMSVKGIRDLSTEMKTSLRKRVLDTLWDKQEEYILSRIPPVPVPDLQVFASCMESNPTVFNNRRTASDLMQQWTRMNDFGLLQCRAGQEDEECSDAGTIARAALNPQDSELNPMECAKKDVFVNRLLHQTLMQNQWRLVSDSSPFFDASTFAVIRGRIVEFVIRSKEVCLGRSTQKCLVDFDLCLEGPARRISRKQAVIKLRNCGEFYVFNEGRISILVDGRLVPSGNRAKLHHLTVIDIDCFQFSFHINSDIFSDEYTPSSQ